MSKLKVYVYTFAAECGEESTKVTRTPLTAEEIVSEGIMTHYGADDPEYREDYAEDIAAFKLHFSSSKHMGTTDHEEYVCAAFNYFVEEQEI